MRMQRQKVKGTGHKQPADAQTEPNFYAMTPSHLRQPTEHSPPPLTSVPLPKAYGGDLSPGLGAVHGAAQLLKTIAAGLPGSASNSPFSLGRQAIKVPPSTDPPPALYQTKPPGGAPPGAMHQQPTLSLLGRVTQAPDNQGDTTPAFVWPPVLASTQAPTSAVSAPTEKQQDWSRFLKHSGLATSESERKSMLPPSRKLTTNLQYPAGIRQLEKGGNAPATTAPKVNDFLNKEHSTDLIENKVMRGIETEEA